MKQLTCGPIYPCDSAVGLLTEIADEIESGTTYLVTGSDDARAIRWALHCVDTLRKVRDWTSNQGERDFIDMVLADGEWRPELMLRRA